MTQQEILMSNEVEDISDQLKKEQDDDARNSMGKTSIMFFDIENMSTTSRLVVLVIILAAFAAIGNFFYKELADQEVDENLVRKELIKMRKEKKGKWSCVCCTTHDMHRWKLLC